MQQLPLFPDCGDAPRARPGQRRLIFATARIVGLRDEQLHDLTETASDYRTRAISMLTVAEAQRLVGLLKTLQRNAHRLAKEAEHGAA